MVEVIDGNVVVEENVSSGVDPILGGVVFLSQDDKNKECKERTYKARGFMVQIIPQDEYLKIRNKIISD